MSERLLITGATGFLGRWTLRHWRKAYPDNELWATGIQPDAPHAGEDRYVRVDLCERESVRNLVRSCRPDRVIHLAGLVGAASLARHLSVNVIGTENLFDALSGLASCKTILQASSASIYGLVRPDELPVDEAQPYRPVSSYGLGKLAQDYLASSMHYRSGLPVIRGCIFNILGPGQPDHLVPMTFIAQLRAMSGRSEKTLRVGSTTPRRDFVDVRDVVRAFDLLLQRGDPGDIYNIGSGRDVSIEEMIGELIALASVDVEVAPAADRVRAVDVPRVWADISRITKTTGWTPEVDWKQSLRDMWNDCDN